MFKEEQTCSTVSSQSPDVGPHTSMGPVMANSGTAKNNGSNMANSSTTANSGSNMTNSSTTANSGSNMANSSTTANSGSSMVNSSTTANSGSDMANGGKTANSRSDMDNNGIKATGGSVKDSCGSTTSDTVPAEDSRGTTVNVGSATGSSSTTINNGSAAENTGTMASGNSATVNCGTVADGGLVTYSSSTTTNGGSTMTNVRPETVGKIYSSLKIFSSYRSRLKKKDVKVLEQVFLRDPEPKRNKMIQIAKCIQKNEDQVKSWFKRRRRKQKKDAGMSKQRKLKYIKDKTQSSKLWNQSFPSSLQANVLPKDRPSVNTSHHPVPEQEVEHRFRDQLFAQTNKHIVNHHGHAIPRQRRNFLHGGTLLNHSHFETNQNANKRKLASEQDINFKFRDQPFVRNYYREINGIRYLTPEQHPLLEGLHTGKACFRSQVNPRPSTNMQDHVQGQEIVVRDRAFVPNYYKEVNSQGYVVPTQHTVHVAPQATRYFYHFPFIPGSGADMQETAKQDKAKFIVSDQSFVPNYNREVSGVGDVSLLAHQSSEGRHAGISSIHHPLFNTGLGITKCNLTLGQEIKVKDALQEHAYNSTIRQLEPTVMLPYWCQDPYCTRFPIPLYRIDCGFRKYLHTSF